MATKEQLIARWEQEPGKSILAKVNAFLKGQEPPNKYAKQAEPEQEEVIVEVSPKDIEPISSEDIDRWLEIIYSAEDSKKTLDSIRKEVRYPEKLSSLLEGLPYREEVPEGKDLRGALLGSAEKFDFQGYDFSYAQISSFSYCNLSHARFDYTYNIISLSSILDGASFRNANLRKSHLDESQIRNACFDGADLMSVRFTDSDLTGSSFRNAKCMRASFSGANLVGCDFRGANLIDASFHHTKLDKTTDLRGANLINARFEELRDNEGHLRAASVDLRQATYDETTRFGKDPLLEDLGEIYLTQYVLTNTGYGEGVFSGHLNQLLTNLANDLRKRYRPNAISELIETLPQEEKEFLLYVLNQTYRYQSTIDPFDRNVTT